MGGKLNAHPLKVSLEVNVILTRQYNLGKGMLHHLINILPRGITSYLFFKGGIYSRSRYFSAKLH